MLDILIVPGRPAALERRTLVRDGLWRLAPLGLGYQVLTPVLEA